MIGKARIKSLSSEGKSPGWTQWLCVLAISSLAACAQIRLIGDYDDVIDKGVSSVQAKTETYFTHLSSTPNAPYDQSFYDGVSADLKVLTTRARADEKHELIQQQLIRLQSSFKDLGALDQATKRPVANDASGNSGMSLGLATIEQEVEQVLKLELALQRGETGASPGN